MIVYVCMFLSLWTMGVIIIRLSNSRYGRSHGYTLLAAGCGSFAFSLELTILPFLSQISEVPSFLAESLRILSIAACYVYWIVFPYCYWLTAVYFSELNNRSRWHRLLMLPAFVSAIYHLASYPLHEIHIEFLRVPAAVYFAFGISLYIWAYLKEKQLFMKQIKFRTVVVFNSAIVWAFISDFAGMSLITAAPSAFTVVSNDVWKYNYWLIAGLVGFHLYFGARYGFLGVKMRLQRQKYNYSMRALTMGTTILNQSLKNEIQKINQLGEQSKRLAAEENRDEALQTVGSLSGVAVHLLTVLNRIKDKADDIHLQETEVPICPLLQELVSEMQLLLRERNLQVQTDFRIDATLRCDRTHIREMFSNLLLNAAEAVEPGKGLISVRTESQGKRVIVEIADNGCGIPKKDFSRVFEPFYTTKHDSSHYGLGLSYCSSVMRKHDGSVSIAGSAAGTGTTIAVVIPGSRVICRTEPGAKAK
ncbi:sensor histidine kinase [Paenibacillus mendelii]|uniref:histidine kinase n=1 Tax=Paenibacillus mendelii TaxID=206163 RepID=A0ABV6JFM7_9BACL|nr:HAMP domain-containing sensor histidine kinase [Paenibacillus mendelii]MCQ6557598.1 HAMP domain-containing histidine kinase [Paenibacillus mendelii]